MKTLPYRNPRRVESLLAAMRQRILLTDGAMGTMIQALELDEDNFVIFS